MQNPWTLVLAAGLIMGLSLGVRHSQGIFLLPITLDRGWSREDFGFAIALQNLLWGVAQPITGMWADRYGSRFVMAGGLVMYGMGLIGMSMSTTPLGFTLSAGLYVGLALSGTAFGVVYGALSRMLPADRRSWGLGVAGAIGGLGQFFLVPLSQGLIGAAGWAGALVILAILCAVALPCVLPIQDRPQVPSHAEQSLKDALTEAFSHRGFWLLNLGFLACGFQLAFIASHLPAYLMDQGLRASDAVAGLAIIALTNVAGTYFCGWLGGHRRRKYLLSAIYLVRSAAMALFVLLPVNVWSLYAFCAVMGFVWLGTVPLTNGLVSQMFGVRYITTLFGFVFLGHQIGAFFGVWLGGYVFDTTQSYQPLWAISIALGVIAALLHYPIDDRELVRSAAVPA
ncbi:MAG: MFS transporter [Hydrogenophaga sp.]|uniref:MFS transporter n=1 Tax=Hydrogenophaga sp. TaxID=1904254 RepID=UPI0027196CF3|nr:MFS transporter [Hydrogenophaga sp.]MDO9568324.1 MFS transporter [Hydrogenophaga sp.]MDP3374255.1 MFS transporter [Hydrogenophaga sp.]